MTEALFREISALPATLTRKNLASSLKIQWETEFKFFQEVSNRVLILESELNSEPKIEPLSEMQNRNICRKVQRLQLLKATQLLHKHNLNACFKINQELSSLS